MAFLDPPYNVRIKSVVGRGRIKHAEFAMASGEMSPSEFTAFLEETLGNAARVSRDGAVHFVCMDWRHIRELIEAGREIYGEMLNLVVWEKTNAGQGSFYRSAHELVGVFRVGEAKHLNNVELGRHGRSRSNVWHYAGVNTFRAGRMDELAAHPTVKPVAMVADALKDCTRRGDIVLDTFAGAGTTILAAERVGRRAYSLELEPKYVDVAIRRWQAFTRRDAVHADTGQTFEDVAGGRKDAQPALVGAQMRRAHGGGPNDETQALRVVSPRTHPTRLAMASRRSTRSSSLASLDNPRAGPAGSAILELRSERRSKRKSPSGRAIGHAPSPRLDAIIQVTFNKALKGDAKSPRCFHSVGPMGGPDGGGTGAVLNGNPSVPRTRPFWLDTSSATG